MTRGPLYDAIGRQYTVTRQADPRIAAAIDHALGDTRSVVNVGAGAGAYEPADREVLAVEPSPVMIAQRPPAAAPVVRAQAEELPLPDSSFDAAMAILSDHHWNDHDRGLAELRRVASRRVVLFTWDPALTHDSWIVRDYFPWFSQLVPPGYSLAQTGRKLGRARIVPVPIPHDCRDGFFHAYWRRPAAYLDEEVRAGISVFARLSPEQIREGLDRLRDDLHTGRWERRHGHLLELDELDLGYRLVVAEVSKPGSAGR